MRSWIIVTAALALAGLAPATAAQPAPKPAPGAWGPPPPATAAPATPPAPPAPPPADPEPSPPPEADVAEPPAVEPEPVTPPPASPEPVEAAPGEGEGYAGPNRLIFALAAGGVGAVGMIMFGAFGLLSNSMLDRLESACPDENRCDPKNEDIADRGRTYTTAANAGLGIGLVGLAACGGIVLWMFLQPDEPESAAAGGPTVAVGPGSIAVQGRF
jgi:hypothetical protein